MLFRSLQKKFFYVPLAIGWFFVILACLLVFAVTRIQTIIDLENSLLKASTGPYFQADNYVYVVESKNMDPMAYYSQNYFSDEEIQSVIDYVTQKSNPSSSSYSFISNGRRYMCTSRSVWENGVRLSCICETARGIAAPTVISTSVNSGRIYRLIVLMAGPLLDPPSRRRHPLAGFQIESCRCGERQSPDTGTVPDRNHPVPGTGPYPPGRRLLSDAPAPGVGSPGHCPGHG